MSGCCEERDKSPGRLDPSDRAVRVQTDVRGKRLKKGKGSPKLSVANQTTSGDPHAGFWPAPADYQERPSGVACSRSEDPEYRSGEKRRRGGALAPRDGRRADLR